MGHRQEQRYCFCSSSLSGTFVHVEKIKNKTCYKKKQLNVFQETTAVYKMSPNEKYNKVSETFYAIILEK